MQDKFTIQAGECITCKDYLRQVDAAKHHAEQALLATTRAYFEKTIEDIFEAWELHIQHHEHTFIPSVKSD